jgi:hypothetical protein
MSYGAQQKFSDKCEDVVTKSWAGAYDNAATEVAAHVLKARPQEADTPYPFEKYIRGCLAHQIEMVDNRLTMRFVEGHIDRAYLNNCATEGERGVVCDLIREGIAALGVVDLNLVVYEINDGQGLPGCLAAQSLLGGPGRNNDSGRGHVGLADISSKEDQGRLAFVCETVPFSLY